MLLGLLFRGSPRVREVEGAARRWDNAFIWGSLVASFGA